MGSVLGGDEGVSISSRAGLRHAHGEIRALTGLRGLAALYVVAYHAGGAAGVDLVPRGYLAVDVFFVLSGFVLALTEQERQQFFFEKKNQETCVIRASTLPQRVRQVAKVFWFFFSKKNCFFWSRRLARILPLNLAVVTMLAAGNLAAHGGAGVPAGRLACNALALQGFGWCVSLNAPAWTLSFEWLAYVLFPVLLLAVRRGGRLACAAVSLTALAGLAALSVHTGRGSLDSSQFGAGWSVVRCLAETALGVLVFRAFSSQAIRQFASRDATAMAVGGLAVCAWRIGEAARPFGWGGDPFLASVFPLAVLVLAANDGAVAAVLGSRLLHGIGVISFSVYLLHDPLLQREARLAAAFWPGWRSAGGAPWFVALATVSVVAPAWIAWRLVERPGRRGLRLMFGVERVVLAAGSPAIAPADRASPRPRLAQGRRDRRAGKRGRPC